MQLVTLLKACAPVRKSFLNAWHMTSKVRVEGGGLYRYDGQAKPLGRGAAGVESKVRRSRLPRKDLGESTPDGRNGVRECPGRAASLERQVESQCG